MTWASWFRFRTWWRSSLVAVPMCWVASAVGLALLVPWWDSVRPWNVLVGTDRDAASQQLSAVASGMMAFTGIVFTALVLLIQFGSTAYSPRLVRWLRRNPVIKHALGAFIACFVFSVFALGQLGHVDNGVLPTRTVLVAFALLLVAVFIFLLLAGTVTNRLRLAAVLQDIDSGARRSIDAVYPLAADHPAEDPPILDPAAIVQEIQHVGQSAVVVAIDRAQLARLGQAAGGLVELVPQLGEYLGQGMVLARVYGNAPVPVKDVQRAVVMGDERTADDDPAFCLRILVDIGIRALSPAVNDPTTAVQVIDRIEDLLVLAGGRDLSVGQVHDKQGTVRVLYPTPTWDDLVDLSVTELRRCGLGSVQVPRRLTAMLDNLVERLPDTRHAALERQRLLLAEWTKTDLPTSDTVEITTSDRLGIGGAGRAWWPDAGPRPPTG